MFLDNLQTDFSFKGDRNYIHGTSVYDFLLDIYRGGGN